MDDFNTKLNQILKEIDHDPEKDKLVDKQLGAAQAMNDLAKEHGLTESEALTAYSLLAECAIAFIVRKYEDKKRDDFIKQYFSITKKNIVIILNKIESKKRG